MPLNIFNRETISFSSSLKISIENEVPNIVLGFFTTKWLKVSHILIFKTSKNAKHENEMPKTEEIKITIPTYIYYHRNHYFSRAPSEKHHDTFFIVYLRRWRQRQRQRYHFFIASRIFIFVLFSYLALFIAITFHHIIFFHNNFHHHHHSMIISIFFVL